MGKEINLLRKYPKSKRNLKERENKKKRMLRILENLRDILVRGYEMMIEVYEVNGEYEQYFSEYNQRIPIMRGKL